MLAGLAPAAADEADFAFVSGMPLVEGDLQRTVESRDSRFGLAVRKRLYVFEHEAFERHTHVIEAACSRLPADAEPTIVALQYFPKDPQSLAVAAMPDLFLEVFARDEDERIRAYQELSGRQMVELTNRFMPSCRNL